MDTNGGEWRFDSLYKLYLGADWLWAKAIAIRESNENPWAVGDNGLAVGLLQQHEAFQDSWHPQDARPAAEVAWYETDKRWHPAYQVACLAQFWNDQRHKGLPVRTKVLTYHWGHLTTLDEDNYWKAVDAVYQGLTQAPVNKS